MELHRMARAVFVFHVLEREGRTSACCPFAMVGWTSRRRTNDWGKAIEIWQLLCVPTRRPRRVLEGKFGGLCTADFPGKDETAVQADPVGHHCRGQRLPGKQVW